ncbi:MAG: phage holin family protein [Fibrobacter sp.]|nr:phage holin family protein [Fibrobacter sp.]
MDTKERPVLVGNEPVVDLIRNLRDNMMTMVRQQIELAKAETSEKASVFFKNFVSLLLWGAILYAGFLLLLAGISLVLYAAFVAIGLPPLISVWLMPIFIAIVILIGGGIGAQKAIRKISSIQPTPQKTIHSVKEDQQWLKEKLK